MGKLKTPITIAGVATALSPAVGLIGPLAALSSSWFALLAGTLGP